MSARPTTRKTTIGLLSAMALGVLAGCSDAAAPDASPEEIAARTLSDALSDADGLNTIAEGIRSAGLEETFAGPGSYTIFAPTDDAFAELEETSALLEEEQRPILVATLRDHIVPGHLTINAIRDAAEIGEGSAEIRTLGEGTLTFSLDGDTINVTGPSGEPVSIEGRNIETGSGVAIPVNGLLKVPELIESEAEADSEADTES